MDESVIRIELDSLYKKFHKKELLLSDPLGLVSTKLNKSDFEIVSYISASLSYGRVEQIQKSLVQLWKRLESVSGFEMGEGLHTLFVDNSWKTLHKDFKLLLKGWVHRFNTAEDMLILLKTLQKIITEQGSLGNLYVHQEAESPTTRLVAFVDKIVSFADKNERDLLSWYVCSPMGGSTCKRMVMWLRWMLRHDEIDPGIWSQNPEYKKYGIGAHLAFIPMDTHVHRWAMKRKLLSTKSPSWKAVEELTAFLRRIDPLDPARFDFCICHQGMQEFRNMTK